MVKIIHKLVLEGKKLSRQEVTRNRKRKFALKRKRAKTEKDPRRQHLITPRETASLLLYEKENYRASKPNINNLSHMRKNGHSNFNFTNQLTKIRVLNKKYKISHLKT